MAHPALVAYERLDGRYNCHYAHWGALDLRLIDELTPETPFGGYVDSQWARDLFDDLLADVPDPDLEGHLSEPEPPNTTVDPVPRARELTVEAIVTEQLDFLHHEALYVVDTDFELTTYLALWFGLTYHAESVGESPTKCNGALRTVRTEDGTPDRAAYVQREFAGLKLVVGDLIDRDVFTHEEGLEYLIDRVQAWTGEDEELRIYRPE
jgi:hypothetical protein